MHAKAYAALSADSPLVPHEIERRAGDDYDVTIDIAYCGICHSDLHQVKNEWGNTQYPIVPGHEIVGTVAAVGSKVTRVKVGDRVGVGCMVNSCRECPSCEKGLEQYCEEGATYTYNCPDRKEDALTMGGYSSAIVTDEAFVLKIPVSLDLAGVAPLLCAGITTYSPLRHWNVGPGMKVGIVGLGGLGHMGIKLASAFGAETYLITTSASKTADAARLGATGSILSKDENNMAEHARSFDLLLNTVSAQHDYTPYLELLKTDGTMVIVGVPPEPQPIAAFSLITSRRAIAGSLIGGIAETQEMLDFCGQHGITADVELIAPAEINEAYERMLRSDVKYRFVIDNGRL